MYYFLTFIFGSSIAFLSLNTSLEMVAFSSLIFLAYFFIEKRSHLFSLIFSYHLVASHGILFGIFNFYISGYILGFISWLIIAIITTLPWILIWSEDIKKRALLFPLVLLVTILPPLGFVDGADPIVSAGLFFPDTGYFGILYYLATLYILVFLSIKYMAGFKKWVFNILILLLFIFGSYYSNKNTSNFIVPLNTEYSFSNLNDIKNTNRQKQLIAKVNTIHSDTILLPEHILGTFKSKHMSLWKTLKEQKTVLAGAYLYDGAHQQYDNVLLSITNNDYKVLYKQRVPVPLAMWIPFTKSKANAYISSTDLIVYKKKKIAVLICYEQYLPYIYLESMWHTPDYVIAISNLWWSKTSIIARSQKYYLILWSRLFGIPYFYALNN